MALTSCDERLFNACVKWGAVPTERTVGRWLHGLTLTTVARLQAIHTSMIARVLATLGVRTWTIDVDVVVVSTGLQVEWAFREATRRANMFLCCG
jgi:hypothetical protein